MPRLIRLYITQICIGFLLSAGFVGLLLALDVAGLRGLILGSSVGWIAVLMLWIFNGIVFAGVQFSIRIMMLAGKNNTSGGKRKPVAPQGGTPIPARVPAK